MEQDPQFWQQIGTELSVEGNAPFYFDQGYRAWVVLLGGIDIFVVELPKEERSGTRHHLVRLDEGQALFELPETKPSHVRLEAVALPGTKLVEIHLKRLQELSSRQDTESKTIQRLLEEWICHLSHAVARDYPPPRTAIQLKSGEEVDLEEGRAAVAMHDLVWVVPQKGASKFLGLEEPPRLVGPSIFPICRWSWIQALTENRIRCVDTAEFMANDPEWNGLAFFYQQILTCLEHECEKRRTAEAASIADQAKAKEHILEASFYQLASVLEPAAHILVVRDDDSLLAACRLVCNKLGIDVKRPPRTPRWQSLEKRLGEIARISRFRLRSVHLGGSWWRQDNGPLLGFMAEDERPVALIPVTARSYRLICPQTSQVLEVTPEVSASLSSVAYVFYRPFPKQALTIRNLMHFSMKGVGRDLLTVLLMGIAGGLLGLLTPIATGLLFDYIIPGDERSQLFQLTLLLIIAAVASSLFQITRNLAMLRVEGKMDYALQAAIWDHLLKLPATFFKRYSAGDLAMRANAISEIRQHLSSTLVTSVMGSIFSLFSFALLFYYDWKLAIVAALFIFVASVLTIIFGYLELRFLRPLYDLQGKIAGLALQLFSGLAKLRVAGAEERAMSIWAKLFSSKKNIGFRIRTYSNVSAAINSVLMLLGTVLIFYFFVFRDFKVMFSTGDFMAFLTAFSSFMAAMLGMSAQLVSILSVVPLYHRVTPILRESPELDDTRREPPELSGEIEVSHLYFRYDPNGPYVLNDVSFKVNPGEFIALVGPSGSGKSTLFRMLLGFEKPELGTVYYDHLDLIGLDVQAVRRQMGIVLQDGKLMPGSIMSNILGSTGLSEEDAWEAARMAGLDRDIKAMPMGMHTLISEGGTTFSGGQMQRLLIARAIINKPRIILFDEATSALDNQTQAIVSRSLEELKSTRIVIAHRLSTIIHADRILVLESGKVVEEGTYEKLISREGLFKELAKRQML